MIALDWTAAMAGLAVGALTSALYFAGLAVGMRHALRSANPVAVLTLSAVLRIMVLLAVAWMLVGLAGPWSGLGFAIAFLIVRLLSTTFARVNVS